MSQKPRTDRSELAEAADALESDLRVFEKAATEMQGQNLDSARNLERGAKALARLAEVEQRLEEKAAVLLRGLREAGARQQAATKIITAFGGELQARQGAYVRLAQAFDDFGREVSGINTLLSEDIGKVDEACDRLEALETRAGELAEEAQADSFQDLVQAARSRQRELRELRTTLLRARGRVAEG